MPDNKIKKARAYCLRLLSIRSRTISGVIEKLKAKGYDEEAFDIIEELVSEGYLDDVKFASEWIEERLRTSPRSKAMIKSELIGKGIDEDIAEKAFFGSGFPDDIEISGSLVERKLREEHKDAGEKLKARLFRFLGSRGFNAETAEDAVNRIVKD